MAISDIFSTSFLLMLALFVITVGLIFAYVSYRLGEQDHKIHSMFSLVSTMAQEQQFFRSKLSTVMHSNNINNESTNLQYASQIIGSGNNSELIHVSDDEDDDDDDEDEDDEDEDEDEDEDDEDEDEDDEDDDDEDDEDDDDHDENLKLDLDVNSIIQDYDNLHFDNATDIKTIHLEQFIHLNEDITIGNDFENNDAINVNEHINENETITNIDIDNQTVNDTTILDGDTSFLKKIVISETVEESSNDELFNKLDYKKLSLNKLRDIVIEKGLTTDASKMKKQELLKLLGDE
jgi:hypothetical protein